MNNTNIITVATAEPVIMDIIVAMKTDFEDLVENFELGERSNNTLVADIHRNLCGVSVQIIETSLLNCNANQFNGLVSIWWVH